MFWLIYSGTTWRRQRDTTRVLLFFSFSATSFLSVNNPPCYGGDPFSFDVITVIVSSLNFSFFLLFSVLTADDRFIIEGKMFRRPFFSFRPPQQNTAISGEFIASVPAISFLHSKFYVTRNCNFVPTLTQFAVEVNKFLRGMRVEAAHVASPRGIRWSSYLLTVTA